VDTAGRRSPHARGCCHLLATDAAYVPATAGASLHVPATDVPHLPSAADAHPPSPDDPNVSAAGGAHAAAATARVPNGAADHPGAADLCVPRTAADDGCARTGSGTRTGRCVHALPQPRRGAADSSAVHAAAGGHRTADS